MYKGQAISRDCRQYHLPAPRSIPEEHCRDLLEYSGALTFILEEDMSLFAINSGCEMVLGYAQDELLGHQWLKAIPPELLQDMQSYFYQRRLDPDSAPKPYDAKLVDKDGKVRHGLFTVDMIPGTSKAVATFVDLTEFQRIHRALRAISAVNGAILPAEDERSLLQAVCRKIVEIGGYKLAWVGYLPADTSQKIKPLAHAGHDNGYLSKLNLCLDDPRRGRGPAGQAIHTGQPVISRSIKNDPAFRPWAKDALRRGFKSAIAIPLLNQGSSFGVLSIYADTTNAFDREEEGLLGEMGSNLAHAVISLRAKTGQAKATRDLEKNLEKMRRLVVQSVGALGTALDLRDPFTAGHQRKVVRLATAIAEDMGFFQEQVDGIAAAASLHDIGTLGIPNEILSKPGTLSAAEFAIVQEHALAGYEILKDIEFPWPLADIVLQHHERMDGSGYPYGLSGEEILIEARILAVADVVEAMASHRPYRPALGIEAALEEIQINSGRLYDYEVVQACTRLFRYLGFTLE